MAITTKMNVYWDGTMGIQILSEELAT